MGDRANLIIRFPCTDGQPGHLYLQTHWSGQELPSILAEVLDGVLGDDECLARDPDVVASPHWSEAHYLAGLLCAHGLEYLGSGVGENERPPLLVDTAARRILVYPDEPGPGDAAAVGGVQPEYPADWRTVITRPAHEYDVEAYIALGLPAPDAVRDLEAWRRVYPEYVTGIEAELLAYEAEAALLSPPAPAPVSGGPVRRRPRRAP